MVGFLTTMVGLDAVVVLKLFMLQDLPDVYTRVSYFLPWMNSTILSNGGLASCNFSLTALPSQGSLEKNQPSL